MLICPECEGIFSEDEATYENVCWEDYYGVGRDFPDKHYGSIMTCPYCGSDGIEEYYEEEEGEEDA